MTQAKQTREWSGIIGAKLEELSSEQRQQLGGYVVGWEIPSQIITVVATDYEDCEFLFEERDSRSGESNAVPQFAMLRVPKEVDVQQLLDHIRLNSIDDGAKDGSVGRIPPDERSTEPHSGDKTAD